MFWSTFIMEQTWSIYTGRPPAMPEYSYVFSNNLFSRKPASPSVLC